MLKDEQSFGAGLLEVKVRGQLPEHGGSVLSWDSVSMARDVFLLQRKTLFRSDPSLSLASTHLSLPHFCEIILLETSTMIPQHTAYVFPE